MPLTPYEQSLLSSWEEVFKKGQLTLWILLALKDGPKYMTAVKDFIGDATNQVVEADDVSMYRALRRYEQAELIVVSATVPGNNGPERKVYKLTATGEMVLKAFCERNITDVFYKPKIRALLERRT